MAGRKAITMAKRPGSGARAAGINRKQQAITATQGMRRMQVGVFTRRGLLALAGGSAAALAAACSPLGTLGAINRITPGDGSARRLARDIRYGAHPRQMLDLYAPAAPGPHPVLVWFYGGSWNSGRRQDYAFAGEALAAAGFVTVVADYRLVPDVVFPGFVQDCAAAVAWAVANIAGHGGDPARIGVCGHSAGAYNALMITLDRQWLAAAGVPGAVKACAALAGPADFAPFTSDAARAAFGSFPQVAATQPISFARGDAVPLWLGTGTADTTVYPRNSLRLAAAIRAAGGRATVQSYPGLAHTGVLLALSRTFRGKAPVLRDMTAFLQTALG
jgi:acetyl esterase/lipase